MRTTLAALTVAVAAVASCASSAPAASAPAAWRTERSGTTSTLYDVGCLTAARCFAVGARSATAGGILLATTDGGRTWRRQAIVSRAPLYRVACALPASCYVIARPATIWVRGPRFSGQGIQ
jgi:photosystem II stability/assembly factor-like uncharacterized protein